MESRVGVTLTKSNESSPVAQYRSVKNIRYNDRVGEKTIVGPQRKWGMNEGILGVSVLEATNILGLSSYGWKAEL